MEEFLTVDEAALLLRVNRKTVYSAVNRGELAAVKIGRTIRIPRVTLAAPAADPIAGPGTSEPTARRRRAGRTGDFARLVSRTAG